ncbi:MAG: PAS domain S-box protein [Bacteroidetes bacterium]|nr:PAS domain S-box protein [Bacteroidota bacterium]
MSQVVHPTTGEGHSLLFPLSHDLVCIADTQGYITEVNSIFEDCVGSDRYEICARPFLEYVHPEDRQLTLRMYGELKAGRSVTRFVNRFRRHDGEYVTLRWNAQLEPKSGRIIAVARDDSTERGKERQVLRFTRILEQSPEEVYLITRDGTITWCNSAAAASLGLRLPDPIGMNLLELDEKSDDTFVELLHMLRGECTVRREIRHLHRDGRLVPKRLRFFYLEGDDDEDLLGVIGHSIEQELHDKQALRESELRFRMLAQNAQDLIYRYRLRPEPGFEYVNPAAERITGYTPVEHYADPLLGTKLVHPDDRSFLDQLQNPERAMNDPVLLRWIRKDGQMIWTEQYSRVIQDRTGQVVAIEGIARDVTRRIREGIDLQQSNEELKHSVEERTTELEETKRELARVNSELQAFASIISHDLHTPLQLISGHIRLVQQGLNGQADAEVTRSLRIALSSTERMHDFIDELLRFSQSAPGTQPHRSRKN